MFQKARTTQINQLVRVNILRAVFILCLPLILFSRSAWPDGPAFELVEVLGLACVMAAVLGRFWAILYIGGHKNSTVMQDGPYSISRHPLYMFSTIGVVGFGLMLGSFVLAAVMGGLTLVILGVTAKEEEAYLRSRFGDAYDTYAARVPMIIPKPSLFATQSSLTISVPHLRQNLMDALVFLLFVPIAKSMEILKNAGLISSFAIW